MQVFDHADDVTVTGVEFGFCKIDRHLGYSIMFVFVFMMSILGGKSGRISVELWKDVGSS